MDMSLEHLPDVPAASVTDQKRALTVLGHGLPGSYRKHVRDPFRLSPTSRGASVITTTASGDILAAPESLTPFSASARP